jgi:flagellar assembly protein FliH
MSKLISNEDLVKYKRWQVPDVSPSGSGDFNQRQSKHIPAVQQEKIQKQAYEEAYARGLREGIENGQAQIRERVKHFTGLANMLEKPLKDTGDAVENELLSLCLAIARQIIRREISVDSGHIVAVIREAISVLPVSSQKMQIHLHPDDAGTVRSVLSDSNDELSWKIVEDPMLSKGDCRIVTEYSQVDATLDRRLAAIAAKIMGGERAGDDKGEI